MAGTWNGVAQLPRAPVARAWAVARWVNQTVERRLYNQADVAARFCRRDARTLLEEGHIHYATPCCDLSTVLLYALRETGFQPTPVLCRIARPFQAVKFQCGLELALEGNPFYLGFSITTGRLAPGRFVPVRARTDVWRADPEAAPLGAPFLASFGLDGPEGLDLRVRGHRLARHVRTYRSSTRRRAFDRARRRAQTKVDRREPHLLGFGTWRPLGAEP